MVGEICEITGIEIGTWSYPLAICSVLRRDGFSIAHEKFHGKSLMNVVMFDSSMEGM